MFDLASVWPPAKLATALRKASTIAIRQVPVYAMMVVTYKSSRLDVLWYCSAEFFLCHVLVSGFRLGASFVSPLPLIQAVLWLFHIHHSCISILTVFRVFLNSGIRLKKKYLQMCPVSFCSTIDFASASSSPKIVKRKLSLTLWLVYSCIWTLALVSFVGLGSVWPSGVSNCDLQPVTGWEAGLQADQLLTSCAECIRFCSSSQRINKKNLLANVKSSVCMSDILHL